MYELNRRETQELLDAVRLVSKRLPIIPMPLHIEPTLQRLLEFNAQPVNPDVQEQAADEHREASLPAKD